MEGKVSRAKALGGIRTNDSRKRISHLRAVGWCVAFIVGIVAPIFVSSGYYLSILTLIVLYASLTSSLDLVVGRIGLASVAHAALFATGAYVLAILTVSHAWPYWLAFLTAIAIAAAVGLVLAVFTLRLRGHYFAISSLAFAGAAVIILTEWESVTRGARGIYGIPKAPDLNITGIGIIFSSAVGQYYLGFCLLVVIVLLIARLHSSAFGRSLDVIRQDEVLAQAFGINIVKEKVKTLMVSAGMAGAAGALYASYISYISPADAGVTPGFNLLVYVMIGGAGTLAGPIVGSAFILGLTEAVRGAELWSNLVFSVVLLVVLLFFRGGIVGGLGERLVHWIAPRSTPRVRIESESVTPQGEVATPESGDILPSRFGHRNRDEDSGSAVTLVQTKGLGKRYGGLTAVQDVSIRVKVGQIVGVIGPNGAGKSTLFGMIAGTIGSSSGQIIFDSRDITRQRVHERVREGIGRTFQTNRVLKEQTVFDNLLASGHSHFSTSLIGSLMYSPRRRNQSDDYAMWLDEIGATVGLAEKMDELAGSLTIEEGRLLAIGMALVTEPRLLMLDEPFAGLRDSETERLSKLLARLSENGVGILLIEHKMAVIRSLCDYCYVLDRGVLIAEDEPKALAQNEAVVSAYLGSQNA